MTDAKSRNETKKSEVLVMDLEFLVRDDAMERGIDPESLEIVRSKTNDEENTLTVQVRGESL